MIQFNSLFNFFLVFFLVFHVGFELHIQFMALQTVKQYDFINEPNVVPYS